MLPHIGYVNWEKQQLKKRASDERLWFPKGIISELKDCGSPKIALVSERRRGFWKEVGEESGWRKDPGSRGRRSRSESSADTNDRMSLGTMDSDGRGW